MLKFQAILHDMDLKVGGKKYHLSVSRRFPCTFGVFSGCDFVRGGLKILLNFLGGGSNIFRAGRLLFHIHVQGADSLTSSRISQ